MMEKGSSIVKAIALFAAAITSIIVNFYGEIKKTRPGDEAGAENTDPE